MIGIQVGAAIIAADLASVAGSGVVSGANALVIDTIRRFLACASVMLAADAADAGTTAAQLAEVGVLALRCRIADLAGASDTERSGVGATGGVSFAGAVGLANLAIAATGFAPLCGIGNALTRRIGARLAREAGIAGLGAVTGATIDGRLAIVPGRTTGAVAGHDPGLRLAA